MITLKAAIDELKKEFETGSDGLTRSQQYKDKLSTNLEFIPEVYRRLEKERSIRDLLKDQIRDLKRKDDVSRINYPKHGRLIWTSCYTDGCRVYYYTKDESGFWPSTKTPVYWLEGKNDEPSKNQEAPAGLGQRQSALKSLGTYNTNNYVQQEEGINSS